jgi:hypothetical protein
MADVADVANALVSLIATAIYPNGVASPSITGAPTRIYYGWPVGENLDADLKNGIVNISVYPPPNMTKKTTRFPKQWQYPASIPPATITATISGDAVTFGGYATPGNVIGLLVNGVGYAYLAAGSDTPATIAASFAMALTALGTLGAGGFGSGDASEWLGLAYGAVGSYGTPLAPHATGATLTVPSPARLEAARTGVTVAAIEETRRQEQGFIVTVWAPTPALRDATAAAFDATLADTDWLPLDDGSAGRLLYRATHSDDVPGVASTWRRAITYTVEYPTLKTMPATTLLFLCGLANINQSAVLVPFGARFPSSITPAQITT